MSSRLCSRPLSPIEASQGDQIQEDEEDRDEEAEEHRSGDDDLEVSEEARRVVKGAKQQYRPSAQEVQVHNRTHTPFRNWCRFCVAGRGPNLPHRRGVRSQENPKNEISADYCFLRDVQGGPSQVVLVGRDRRTGVYFSHAVPHKGAGLE